MMIVLMISLTALTSASSLDFFRPSLSQGVRRG